MSDEAGVEVVLSGCRLPDSVEAALLGQPATLDWDAAIHGAQMSLPSVRSFWQALGFQLVQDEDARFAEADIVALREVARLIRDEAVSEDLALAMTRAFGRTADRLAVWQTQLVSEAVAAAHLPADPTQLTNGSVAGLGVARAAAGRLVELADDLEPLLVYAWRRHLTGAISRMLAEAGEAATSSATSTLRIVGFADLVEFTSMVSRMTEQQVAALVQRFEMLSSDIVTTHGGRVIKTVGDEILFSHNDSAPAAAIALDLVQATEEDDLLPSVRVGMALGAVVSRLGDVFGTTVNIASRLTAVAPPGRVYVDDALAKRLSQVSGFAMTELRRRHLRGIGMITPSELRRAAGERRTAARSSAR